MPLLRNDNEHRIYYGEDGAHKVPAGGIFEGSAADAKRPGVSEVTGKEADDFDAENRGEGAPVTDETGKAARDVRALSRLAAHAGTAPLRDAIDEEGHRQVGTGLTREPNKPSSPPSTGVPAHDPAAAGREQVPGTEDTSAGRIGEIVSDASEAVEGVSSDASSAADGLDGLTKDELQELADENDVEYASRDTNDDLRAKLRAEGVTAED